MPEEYSTQVLFENLDRIESTVPHDIKANDIIRDSESPSLNVYYKRFGNSWSDVMSYYSNWKQTGQVPDDIQKNWQEFVRSKRNGTDE